MPALPARAADLTDDAEWQAIKALWNNTVMRAIDYGYKIHPTDNENELWDDAIRKGLQYKDVLVYIVRLPPDYPVSGLCILNHDPDDTWQVRVVAGTSGKALISALHEAVQDCGGESFYGLISEDNPSALNLIDLISPRVPTDVIGHVRYEDNREHLLASLEVYLEL